MYSWEVQWCGAQGREVVERLEKRDRSLEMRHVLVNDYPALLACVNREDICEGPQCQSEKVLEGLEWGNRQYSCPEPRCVISAGPVNKLQVTQTPGLSKLHLCLVWRLQWSPSAHSFTLLSAICALSARVTSSYSFQLHHHTQQRWVSIWIFTSEMEAICPHYQYVAGQGVFCSIPCSWSWFLSSEMFGTTPKQSNHTCYGLQKVGSR